MPLTIRRHETFSNITVFRIDCLKLGGATVLRGRMCPTFAQYEVCCERIYIREESWIFRTNTTLNSQNSRLKKKRAETCAQKLAKRTRKRWSLLYLDCTSVVQLLDFLALFNYKMLIIARETADVKQCTK